ncbi:MAG TPA: restriction endonuclease subunit S [Candidatus Paceibacterota bacterium]|nr:restriction endonuclease subunit S [Candidatus Paceibacterota bacterium]
MQSILINLGKVRESGRADYDFYDPNQKNVIDTLVKGYKTEKLGDVCLKVNTGKTAPRDSYPETGVRIIKVKNISGNGIKWHEKSFVSEEFYSKAEKKAKVQIGDILMLCAAHNKSYIGRADIVDTLPKEVIEDSSKCCCVGELIIIRANPEKILPEYLITYLRLSVVQEQIRRMVKGQSAHLYPRDLVGLDVILPPVDLQQEIAKINSHAEKSYLTTIRQASAALAEARARIEDTILKGKKKSK